MNEKLRIEIAQYGNVVIGRVLEQPEELREAGKLAEYDGLSLYSEVLPAVVFNTLYIRGEDRNTDERTMSFAFDDEQEAAEYIGKARRLVRMVNDDLAGKQLSAETMALTFEVLE